MSAAPPTLVDRLAALCAEGSRAAAGTAQAEAFRRIEARLRGPLRVAIAGRVKAGKSTLLNALVGERVAPTDAGECTRIVTWYSHGISYDVRATMLDGRVEHLRFRREDGRFEIDLGGLDPDQVARLDVSWPSSRLQHVTLIDTPGLASINDANSLRTRDFFSIEEDSPSEADAVVYLLRHMHGHDQRFLEAFVDHSIANASPVNAVGVLSRADEVGSGRSDAMQSADHIADRYAHDERVRSLVVGVHPVAGLLAETAATLREDEADALRQVAALDQATLETMLLSADRFTAPELSNVAHEVRSDLLGRFGMFGVRFAVGNMHAGQLTTAAALARAMADLSGIAALRSVLDGHFTSRAFALKARTALASLRFAARALDLERPGEGARLLGEIERVEASSHELAEMRLVHMLLAEIVRLAPDQAAEAERVTSGGSPRARLGLAEDAPAEEGRAAALAGVDAWRRRSANPLATMEQRDACEILARSYEGIYVTFA